MVHILPFILAIGLSAAPRAPAGPAEPPAWVKDCASELLARTMMAEARARLKAAGREQPPEAVRPTREDLQRASARILKTLDELLLLSGLVPASRGPGTALADSHERPDPESIRVH
ncbi:MAG: hypothetical protein HY815_12840 [Candidatus Riflebacteria bacterium]|nr:hypothetical protein [Candidatus Riflebacteria bacterium]